MRRSEASVLDYLQQFRYAEAIPAHLVGRGAPHHGGPSAPQCLRGHFGAKPERNSIDTQRSVGL